MIYQPSKKELKQIENLNKGYALIKEGLKLIKTNLTKRDSDVELHMYRMARNFDKLIKRIQKILEKQYIDSEFIHIINSKAKGKGSRFNKSAKKCKKPINKKKAIRKKKSKG